MSIWNCGQGLWEKRLTRGHIPQESSYKKEGEENEKTINK